VRRLETDGGSFDVFPSQAMTASLSSLDLEHGATVIGREGRDDFGGSGMASVSSAESSRITPAEDGEEGSQGLAPFYVDMAPAGVRALLIPVRGDMFNRGETVVAQLDDCTPAY
jgi:hypothetical protein